MSIWILQLFTCPVSSPMMIWKPMFPTFPPVASTKLDKFLSFLPVKGEHTQRKRTAREMEFRGNLLKLETFYKCKPRYNNLSFNKSFLLCFPRTRKGINNGRMLMITLILWISSLCQFLFPSELKTVCFPKMLICYH